MEVRGQHDGWAKDCSRGLKRQRILKGSRDLVVWKWLLFFEEGQHVARHKTQTPRICPRTHTQGPHHSRTEHKA